MDDKVLEVESVKETIQISVRELAENLSAKIDRNTLMVEGISNSIASLRREVAELSTVIQSIAFNKPVRPVKSQPNEDDAHHDTSVDYKFTVDANSEKCMENNDENTTVDSHQQRVFNRHGKSRPDYLSFGELLSVIILSYCNFIQQRVETTFEITSTLWIGEYIQRMTYVIHELSKLEGYTKINSLTLGSKEVSSIRRQMVRYTSSGLCNVDGATILSIKNNNVTESIYRMLCRYVSGIKKVREIFVHPLSLILDCVGESLVREDGSPHVDLDRLSKEYKNPDSQVHVEIPDKDVRAYVRGRIKEGESPGFKYKGEQSDKQSPRTRGKVERFAAGQGPTIRIPPMYYVTSLKKA